MSTAQQARLAEGRKLRDKLRAEGRHHDAEVLQSVIRSAEASSGLNTVLTNDLRQLREAARRFRNHSIISGCRPIAETGQLRDLFNDLDELLA